MAAARRLGQMDDQVVGIGAEGDGGGVGRKREDLALGDKGSAATWPRTRMRSRNAVSMPAEDRDVGMVAHVEQPPPASWHTSAFEHARDPWFSALALSRARCHFPSSSAANRAPARDRVRTAPSRQARRRAVARSYVASAATAIAMAITVPETTIKKKAVSIANAASQSVSWRSAWGLSTKVCMVAFQVGVSASPVSVRAQWLQTGQVTRPSQ